MMAYRIVRSPERRVFYIDVGNIAPQDIEQHMLKVMEQMKRNQIVDADTGRVDLRYNPMSVDEDYFLPVRGDTATRIETLPGGSYTGDIDDVRYLRDKLFSALKVPASYLSRAEGAEEDKTTLAQKDVRFARTIQRLQRSVLSELEKVGIIHLYTLGFRGEDLLAFKLTLNNPSKIAELQELEHWRTKFDVASAAVEGFFSRRWVSEKLFNMSEEEFLRNQREMFYDKKMEASLEAVVGEAMMGAEAGAGPAGGMPMGDEAGMPPPPPEEIPPEEAASEEEEEDVLLAAPEESPPLPPEEPVAKRDDGSYLTSRAKGKWYKPLAGGDRRPMGARKRSNLAQGGGHMASGARRTILPGYSDILSLANLGRVGLSESLREDYKKDEEEKIFQVSYNVKKLITELESMEKKDDGKAETQ